MPPDGYDTHPSLTRSVLTSAGITKLLRITMDTFSNPSPLPDSLASTNVETFADIGRTASEFLSKAKATNTKKAYAADWDDFLHWCRRFQRIPLPALPETVAFYLSDCASRLKTSTFQRRLATISEAHKTVGLESPTRHAQVRFVWAGIRRELGSVQAHRKPVLTPLLKAMLTALPDSLVGIRDRGLLLLGFAGALRRSELVALDVADIAYTEDGLVVLIRKSKTDPSGIGRKIGIPMGEHPETCPVKAMMTWLDASKIEEGPLFRRVDRHACRRKSGPHPRTCIVASRFHS